MATNSTATTKAKARAPTPTPTTAPTTATATAPAPQATALPPQVQALQATHGLAPAVLAAVLAVPSNVPVQGVPHLLGAWPTGQRGQRQYAHGVALALAHAMPGGFGLNQYRAALVAGANAAHAQGTPVPTAPGGWGRHNMPTYTSNPKQAWLAPVHVAQAMPTGNMAGLKAATTAPAQAACVWCAQVRTVQGW
jgi:hypothetical protein